MVRVRTTIRRLQSFEEALDEAKPWWAEHARSLSTVEQVTATKVEVTLPAVAWRLAIEMLEDVAFTPRGMKRRGHSHQVLLLTDIVTAFNAFRLHPAFPGWRAMKVQHEYIPGFESWQKGEDVSPFPTGGKFLIAQPHFEMVQGHMTTFWKWMPARTIDRWSERVLKEETHLVFSRDPHLVTGEDLHTT